VHIGKKVLAQSVARSERPAGATGHAPKVTPALIRIAATLVLDVGWVSIFVWQILSRIPERPTKGFGAIISPVAGGVMSVTSPPPARAVF
jgi:hypothetical protein